MPDKEGDVVRVSDDRLAEISKKAERQQSSDATTMGRISTVWLNTADVLAMVAELTRFRSSGEYRAGVETAARICDEDAETLKADYERATKSRPASLVAIRFGARMDEARNLANSIRALAPAGGAGEVEKLVEALKFYADPEVYHGCAFMFDRPTGGFDGDFSKDHGHEHYKRAMPGKTARAALRSYKGGEK